MITCIQTISPTQIISFFYSNLLELEVSPLGSCPCVMRGKMEIWTTWCNVQSLAHVNQSKISIAHCFCFCFCCKILPQFTDQVNLRSCLLRDFDGVCQTPRSQGEASITKWNSRVQLTMCRIVPIIVMQTENGDNCRIRANGRRFSNKDCLCDFPAASCNFTIRTRERTQS